jgi:hypothetical protein
VAEERGKDRLIGGARQKRRRASSLRSNDAGRPTARTVRRLEIREHTAIIVVDGIATGATMRVALRTTRSRAPSHLVVAVPVAPPDTLADLSKNADETVYLETPIGLEAIGFYYRDFHQMTDAEVSKLLARAPLLNRADSKRRWNSALAARASFVDGADHRAGDTRPSLAFRAPARRDAHRPHDRPARGYRDDDSWPRSREKALRRLKNTLEDWIHAGEARAERHSIGLM